MDTQFNPRSGPPEMTPGVGSLSEKVTWGGGQKLGVQAMLLGEDHEDLASRYNQNDPKWSKMSLAELNLHFE